MVRKMERLIQAGRVPAKSAAQVEHSAIGIGFEKLDRGVFEPEKAYDKVAALGVKWVRIQSGWARTEKERGVYDFSWLDSIVDNLLSRGLKPWVCLCYGNPLYTELAGTIFGAVGCVPIHTEEEREAWDRYVRATVSHFRGRVGWYEVWNEPDWCWRPTPQEGCGSREHGIEVGQFNIRTARAIRQSDPEAHVIGGSFCQQNLEFINYALATGMAEEIDAVSYHQYTPREREVGEWVNALRELCHLYNPRIEIIQGESGFQSRSDGCGACAGGSWTPLKQAKQLLRHSLANLMAGVKFTSYFSTMDMIEALNGKVGDKASYLDYGYFGVLGADFDENGVSTGEYTPKPSYYALQALASLFAGDFTLEKLPIHVTPRYSPRIFAQDCEEPTVMAQGFGKPNGSRAFAYWNSTPLMTTSYGSTITLQAAGLTGGREEIRLVDLLDGQIYRLPDSMVERRADGYAKLLHLPITDAPLLLTFGDFIG